MIICAKCGHENPGDAAFCGNPGCDFFLQDAAPVTPAALVVPPGGVIRSVAGWLTPARLSVDPGAEGVCELVVRNTGTVVDEYAVSVLGPVAPWTTVAPPFLPLLPDAEATTRLVFRPPRASTPAAGPLPFAVSIVSKADARVRKGLEGMLEVRPFTSLALDLAPRTSQGRRSARHQLRVANVGNAPVSVGLGARDPDDALRFEVSPETLTVPPGGGAATEVRVRPRGWYLLGPPRQHPLEVMATPVGEAALTTQGAMRRRALIPAWALALGAALIALLAALALLLPKAEVPSVARVDPPALGAGSTQVIKVSGSNFDPPTVAFVPPEGITGKLTSASADTLVLSVTVDPSAVDGGRDVIVMNSSGKSGRCHNCFQVTHPTRKPVLTVVSPTTLKQGATQQTLVLSGMYFNPTPPPAVTFDPGGLVYEVREVTSTQIVLLVGVDPSAPPGKRTVTVTNTDGGTGSCPSVAGAPPCFTVTANGTTTSTSSSRGGGSSGSSSSTSSKTSSTTTPTATPTVLAVRDVVVDYVACQPANRPGQTNPYYNCYLKVTVDSNEPNPSPQPQPVKCELTLTSPAGDVSRTFDCSTSLASGQSQSSWLGQSGAAPCLRNWKAVAVASLGQSPAVSSPPLTVESC